MKHDANEGISVATGKGKADASQSWDSGSSTPALDQDARVTDPRVPGAERSGLTPFDVSLPSLQFGCSQSVAFVAATNVPSSRCKQECHKQSTVVRGCTDHERCAHCASLQCQLPAVQPACLALSVNCTRCGCLSDVGWYAVEGRRVCCRAHLRASLNLVAMKKS